MQLISYHGFTTATTASRHSIDLEAALSQWNAFWTSGSFGGVKLSTIFATYHGHENRFNCAIVNKKERGGGHLRNFTIRNWRTAWEATPGRRERTSLQETTRKEPDMPGVMIAALEMMDFRRKKRTLLYLAF